MSCLEVFFFVGSLRSTQTLVIAPHNLESPMEEKALEDKLSASCGEQSWSSTCGFGRSSGGGGWSRRKKKFPAPRCKCGSYAILFQSSTVGNPNRLFFGCSNFKTTTPHCKYFSWLDEFVSSFSVKEDANRGEVFEDMVKLEEKMVALENLVAGRSTANKESVISKSWGLGFFLLGIVFTIGFLALIRV
ncbi:hypothetical protein PIB30_092141 [Stylosanthes scabra]|uniref:GRF-type domain-containing protein n=1 Tax=Stylosanthes scabra TaxID=79078 RepID=A0ABU6RV46_9FABA|nr:hypothetical protein [Stylosanthes scabra]